jgi:hypothetical protein
LTLPQVETTANEFPATILKLLGIDVPPGLPQPDEEIVKRFNPKAVVLIMIDNFGLFEAVVYKPETLIKRMEALALLATDDPLAVPLINTVLRGPQGIFHLIQYIKDSGKFTKAICRKEDARRFSFDTSYTIPIRDDMKAYIEATKYIFRSDLLFMHFLDFESLYAQYGHRTPPKTLLEKIVRRTDNWVKVLSRQARDDTLFVIIGNHGREPVPLDYEGKLGEWRQANAPIAIMFQKKAEDSE